MAGWEQKRRYPGRAKFKAAQLASVTQGNPIEKVQGKINEVTTKAKAWMEKQPAPVAIGLVTLTQAVQGAFIGGLMGQLTGDIAQQAGTPEGQVPQEKLDSMKALSGGPWVQAKNFAVITGVNQGIATAMKRYRKGKEDLLSSVVPAFGSGAAFSLVSGMGADAPGGKLGSAMSSGVGFAVFQGALYQVGKKFGPKPQNDVDYLYTRHMLQELNLEKWEKNLRSGQLNDQTLPLLTDSALKDVRIPPGPRLLILEAVHRRKKEVPPPAARKPVVSHGKTVVKT